MSHAEKHENVESKQHGTTASESEAASHLFNCAYSKENGETPNTNGGAQERTSALSTRLSEGRVHHHDIVINNPPSGSPWSAIEVQTGSTINGHPGREVFGDASGVKAGGLPQLVLTEGGRHHEILLNHR